MYAPTASELRERLDKLRSPSESPPTRDRRSSLKRTIKMGYHTWTPGMLNDQLLAELRTRREGSRCDCCPYGYHIHRDFVTYCDSLGALAADSQLEHLRKARGERRKQRKCLENYLRTLETEQLKQAAITAQCLEAGRRVPTKLTKAEMSAPPPDLLSVNDDALKEVFRDFEDVLSSHERDFPTETKTDLTRVDLLRHAPEAAATTDTGTSQTSSIPPLQRSDSEQRRAQEVLDMVFGTSRSRSDSLSSTSSRSTVTSTSMDDNLSQSCRNTSQRLVESMAALSSPNPWNGGNNSASLTRVRQLVASSLKQLRQLEEQVKTIPLLQVKISILKEEKRLLALQLKARASQTDVHASTGEDISERLRKLDDNGIATPRLQCRTEDETDVAASLAAFAASLDAAFRRKGSPCFEQGAENSKRSVAQGQGGLNIAPDIPKAVQIRRTVGVECSAETRSVGVGSDLSDPACSQCGLRIDTWCQSNTTCARCLERNLKERRSRGTNTELPSSMEIKKRDGLCFAQFETTSVKPERQPCPECMSRVEQEIRVVNAATATEAVLSVDVGVEVDTRSVAPKTMHRGSQTPRILKGSIGIQVTPPLARRRDVCIQLDIVEKRHIGLQVDLRPVTQKPALVSVGTGSFNVKDIVCDCCRAIQRRSVGVGQHIVTRDAAVGDISVADTVVSKLSRGSGSCSVFDNFCDKCELKQTETIGVGEADANESYCEGCRKRESEKLARRSMGTETADDQQIMTRSGSFGVNLCDKCSSQIEDVAKVFVDKNALDPELPTLGIPKLAPRAARSRPTSAHLGFDKRQMLLDGLDKQVPERTEPRHVERTEKHELNKETKAACKVLNDYLMKPERGDPNKLKTAVSLIQQEWFRVASPANADPNVVEDYMDSFEEYSRHLLHRIVNMADINGNTAIHYAVSHGNFDLVSVLLDSKVCDVSKQNKAGYTCMMLVSLADIKNDTHRHVVQRLFQLGDVNTKATQNGQTALMLAASHGRLETVKLLLEAGAEPNVQDSEGSTALMCAAEHGHIEIVRALLAHPDTELGLVDSDGSTALQIAMEAGHKDTALLIYANSNFSRGSSPYSSLRIRNPTTPRSTPPPSRPPRTPPPPQSPARSRRSSSSH